MIEITTLLLVVLIGLATGFFDSVIGAGGLISVPSLMYLGFPPQIAIATDRFGTLGQTVTALIKFWKAKKIVWKYVPILAVISLAGSVIGDNMLLNVDQKVLKGVVGILILIILPFIFLKKRLGVQRTKPSRSKTVVGLLLYFAIMIFAGFFGQGTGPMIFYALTFFLGLTMLEVLGTGIIPWFVLSLSSVIIFALNDIINYKIGLILLVSMSIGSYIGAHVAIKKGDLWVKRLFILFVVVSGIKLLLF